MKTSDRNDVSPAPIVSMIECDGRVYVATQNQVFELSRSSDGCRQFWPVRFGELLK